MLDKQINLFNVSTTAFLTKEEKKLNLPLTEKKRQLGELTKELKMWKKFDTKLSTEDTRFVLGRIIDDIIICEQEVKELHKITKKALKEKFAEALVAENKKIRKLDLSYVQYKNAEGDIKPNMNNLISMFASELSRTFKVATNELTKDILVVDMFYYDLSRDLVVNGFDWGQRHFVYFSSSAGQIRKKKAVFVSERLWNKYQGRLMCGIDIDYINKCGGMNTNKFLAYLALSNTASEQWETVFGKKFDIDRAVVVDDFETMVRGRADYIDCDTYLIKENCVDDFLIPHSDGSGLVCSEYSGRNFMIRLPFVKGLLCSFDFRRFCRENNVSKITDIWGKEYDIFEDDVRFILTKSQTKLNTSVFSSWQHYIDNFKKNGCEACVCNIEGSVVKNARLNYQMLQNLDMADDEISKLCERSNDKIKKISDSLENMLSIFGVRETSELGEKQYFSRALQIYPELLQDVSNKTMLRELKDSLVTKYKSGKIELRCSYHFVAPDLYAMCENIFLKIKEPEGLLKNNEVFCRKYRNVDKLDCLRSPALYREHPVRNNVCNKKYRNQKLSDWFKTDAIYTSCHDLISRVLQFDM